MAVIAGLSLVVLFVLLQLGGKGEGELSSAIVCILLLMQIMSQLTKLQQQISWFLDIGDRKRS
jgi:hypothetical protein